MRVKDTEQRLEARELKAKKESVYLMQSIERVEAARKGTEEELERLKSQRVEAAAAPRTKPEAAPAAAPPSGELVDLSQRENKVFSQNGEDGVLEAIFEAIGTTNKFYVEFGTETGVETNSRILREQKGWAGLLLDGGHENLSINLHQHFLTAENIVELFTKYSVPRDLDLLSVDVDRNDWYILRSIIGPDSAGALSSAAFRPRAIVVEYNSDWQPPDDKVVPYDGTARWDGTNFFGASIAAFSLLARFSGYTLVYADQQGVNLFFVANELQPQALFKYAGDEAALWRPPGYANCRLYYRVGGHCEDSRQSA